jgi:hypothetical protein
MANTNAPFGLRPVRYLNGAPWNGQVSRYLIPATDGTAYYIGDPVTLAGDAGASGSYVNGVYTGGMPTVSIGIAGSTCIGAIVGFEVNPSGLDKPSTARRSVARVALVADDPMIVFHMQESELGHGVDERGDRLERQLRGRHRLDRHGLLGLRRRQLHRSDDLDAEPEAPASRSHRNQRLRRRRDLGGAAQ